MQTCPENEVRYKRISFNSQTLNGIIENHINTDTIVTNTVKQSFPSNLPIYQITEREITQSEFEQLLNALELSDDPEYPYDEVKLDGNEIYVTLKSYTDTSRGYFDMTNEELEKLAWELFKKIPFMEGEYEYLGIRDTMKSWSAEEGEQITRVGVSFCRLLDGVRVVDEENCMLYFDGSGLVGIRINLFNYTQTGSMDMVALKDAEARIKTPDAFSIETESQDKNIATTLRVDQIDLRLVNQHSKGCAILQPLYIFSGTAAFEDGSQADFSSQIIAIPESYTYEEE